MGFRLTVQEFSSVSSSKMSLAISGGISMPWAFNSDRMRSFSSRFPRSITLCLAASRISVSVLNISLLLSITNATVGTNAQLSLVVAISRKRNGNAFDPEYIARVEVEAMPTMAKPAICHRMPRSFSLNGASLLDFRFHAFSRIDAYDAI